LWPETTFIMVGSPTSTSRALGNTTHRLDQIDYGRAAHLLVIGKGQLQRTLERARAGARHGVKRQCVKPFMSQAPRPKSFPSRSVSVQGSVLQAWPSTGTTSVWPDRMTPPSISGPTWA
jgi:hypothetical protein